MKPELRPYILVNGRNIQRNLRGSVERVVRVHEKQAIDLILQREEEQLLTMDLLQAPLSKVEVNPTLIIFLDGPDGLGGYADTYAQAEWKEPGTKIEMEQEAKMIAVHLSATLNAKYIESLRETQKPLVIIEGGAGPDMRTIGTVMDVLLSKADSLKRIPIRMIHVDISRRMAALTASKTRLSKTFTHLTQAGLDIRLAICHADVFDLLEKMPNDSLSYALLPFGVLSFGLDGKDPTQTLTHVREKLLPGAGVLATVYNTKWREYTDLIEQTVEQVNKKRPGNKARISTGDLSPFVIKILDGKLQVGGGLAFECRTYDQPELAKIFSLAGFTVVALTNTPRGWAYWPQELLGKITQGKLLPDGIPETPPPYLMKEAKKSVQALLEQDETDIDVLLLDRLFRAIPDGKTIEVAAAPYITVTAQKSYGR